jgi:hypothetical protein
MYFLLSSLARLTICNQSKGRLCLLLMLKLARAMLFARSVAKRQIAATASRKKKPAWEGGPKFCPGEDTSDTYSFILQNREQTSYAGCAARQADLAWLAAHVNDLPAAS